MQHEPYFLSFGCKNPKPKLFGDRIFPKFIQTDGWIPIS